MSRRYSLDRKIDALNQLRRHDSDVLLVSDLLEIPAGSLRNWLREEAELRGRYEERCYQEQQRMKAELRHGLLERSQAILAQMDGDTLAKAPLNQLASALGSLMNYAMKLEEPQEGRVDAEEQVIRFEYVYDDQVQGSPPWSSGGEAAPGALQGRRLWPPLGQDRAGEDADCGAGFAGGAARLVARADDAYGEPGLAGPEEQRPQPAQPANQRK